MSYSFNELKIEIDRLRTELTKEKADADSLRAERAEADVKIFSDALGRAEARIAELEAGQICGACGQLWDGQGCAQKDNDHPFQTCYPVVNESPMRARAERAEAELKAMRELLIWLNRKGGLGIEVHDRISTALNRSPPD